MTISKIFENQGEKYFRETEKLITLKLLKKNKTVISLGGGAFLNNTIRKKAKKLSISFWLDVPVDELIKRLKKSRKRPLLFKKNRFFISPLPLEGSTFPGADWENSKHLG